MSQRYPSSWKNCATCVYWVADRDVDTVGSYAIVDSTRQKGKCMCRHSGWRRMEREAQYGCPDYEKWPVLS